MQTSYWKKRNWY